MNGLFATADVPWEDRIFLVVGLFLVIPFTLIFTKVAEKIADRFDRWRS